MRRVPCRHDRHRGRGECRGVKAADLVQGHRPQRFLGANREMAIGVARIQQPREGPVGQRRRHVAQLHEPVEAQLTYALEIPGFETRPDHHVGQQYRCPIGKPRERGNRENRGVRSHLGIQMRTDATERVVEFERVQVAAALVQHVARHRGQAGPLRRIGGGSDRQQGEKADERYAVVLDGPHPQPVGEPPALDLWELERPIGPEGGKPRRRPSESCLVNTAIVGGFPAATNNCWNACSISSEGMDAMIASPSSFEYHVSISNLLSTIFVNFWRHLLADHLQWISSIGFQLSFWPTEFDVKTSNWI